MEAISIMSYEHIIGGIIAGIISFLFTVKGLLPISNEMLGVLISSIILNLILRCKGNGFF